MSGWFTGCFFKTDLDEVQIADAFEAFLKEKGCSPQGYELEFSKTDDGIQIEGGPEDIDDGEVLAEFISRVIKEDYVVFNSEYEGEKCAGWMVGTGYYEPVFFDGTIYGVEVYTYLRALTGDPELKKEKPNYRYGIVRVTLSEVIERDREGFLDLISERLVKSGRLSNITHKVLGCKSDDDNTLLIKVEGFEEKSRGARL